MPACPLLTVVRPAPPLLLLQYDFSGVLMNASPMLRKPIPDPNNPNDPEYKVCLQSFHAMVDVSVCCWTCRRVWGWVLCLALGLYHMQRCRPGMNRCCAWDVPSRR